MADFSLSTQREINNAASLGQTKWVSQIPVGKESLVKSKQRVADHGEVFTPSWMVEDMLNLVKDESERIDSRFLEPACGWGRATPQNELGR